MAFGEPLGFSLLTEFFTPFCALTPSLCSLKDWFVVADSTMKFWVVEKSGNESIRASEFFGLEGKFTMP